MYETLIPPRTELSIPPGLLNLFANKGGWVVQVKKNGTNTVVVVEPDRKVHSHNRRGEPHKAWSFTDGSSDFFRSIPGKGRWVFNAELMHSKVPGLRDIHYLHDVLVADGVELWGVTYGERKQLLFDICTRLRKPMSMTLSHTVLDDHTWLAMDHTSDFRELYNKLTTSEDEGLMLKMTTSVYKPSDCRKCTWMVKCRRTGKNLSF